ncbi:MAG: hypothetical protein JSV58_06525 [Candidatus Bathyarchaeota archaeon]|nr:MAG: hypothetical protein JSV58_06525 [Candidatus Bathyarchaeota archaeon]
MPRTLKRDMTTWVDLQLRPTLTNAQQTKSMIRKARELGYRVVGISLPLNPTPNTIQALRDLCCDASVDLVTRLDLAPSMPHELLLNLRRFRRKFEVISVMCCTKAVARQAAKDRRVDLLAFSMMNSRDRFFDRAEAELASKASTSLEVNLAPLLSLRGQSRIRILTQLRKEMVIAEGFGVKVALSSGATNLQSMRSPSDFVAIASLFDFPEESANQAFSEVPIEIVKQNREKLSKDYVAPGIRVVKGLQKRVADATPEKTLPAPEGSE